MLTSLSLIVQMRTGEVSARLNSHPEDIVEEETSQQDTTVLDAAQRDHLNSIDGEGKPKDVISNPVLK